jgi:hypothetical protein
MGSIAETQESGVFEALQGRLKLYQLFLVAHVPAAS